MSKQKLILVLGILTLILGIRFYLFYRNQPQYRDGQAVNFETTLLSEPQISTKFQKFSVNLASGQRIFITTSIEPQFHYGNSLRISSSLKFRVLKNKKIISTMFFPKIEATGTNKNLLNFLGKNALAVANSIRQKTIFLFERTLPTTSASLLLGIVFGIKESMPAEFMNNLRLAGVLHVVAASGMNVTIVGGFLSSLFSLLLRRQMALLASILGILFYALLAGLGASIIRASIMGTLVFSAAIFGRQTLALLGLILAGALMLFISPTLLFDVGFQLSFAATLGLLYLKPMIEGLGSTSHFSAVASEKPVGALTYGKHVLFLLKKALLSGEVATTIAAQLATLPILLANFGTYSLWSVVVNGLVLWTIPLLMTIGGLGAILGFIVFPLGSFILYFSLPLLLYFEKMVNTFSALPGVLQVENVSWGLILGYYSLLTSVLLIFKQRPRRAIEK